MGSGVPGGGGTKPAGGGTRGIIGMIGMIIPPEVIGPGAAVGSQIGPVCMTRPMSGFPDENGEREVTDAREEAVRVSEEVLDVPKKVFETCEEEAGIFAEVLDVGTPNKVLDNLAVDGEKEEGVKVRCVVDTEAVVPHVEYTVAVPLIHVVFGVRVQETEDSEPGELSQSQ